MKRFQAVLKFAGLFGLGLAIAGLTAGFVAGAYGPIPTAMIVAGVVCILLWLIFLGRFDGPDQVSFWQRRSTTVGTNAVISTLAVLVILGLVNFVAARNPQRVDLTETQLFTLAPETQDVLKKLDQPTKVWIFDKTPNPQDSELLKSFQRQAKNFSYEVADPDLNPGLAQRFAIKNDPVNKDVYVERGGNPNSHRFVQSISQQQRLLESKLVNSLIQVSSTRQPKVYFVQGHGERTLTPDKGSISTAVKELQGKNFTSELLNLAQVGQVPADAAVVVLAGPQKPLFDPEIQALEDYQGQGGNLLVLVDPKSKANLDGLLKKWGIVLDQRVAIDASGAGTVLGLGPATPLVQDYSDHPITRTFKNGISFYPLARPLEIQAVEGVQANPIVLTVAKSWAETNLDEKPVKLDADDRQGPLPIGVALSRIATPPSRPTPSPSPSPQGDGLGPAPSPTPSPSNAPNAVKKESRLVVFGNSTFAADGYFEQQINGDVFLNSVSWLSQEGGQTLSIRPREMKSRRLTPSKEQAMILVGGSLVLLPLLGLITAAVLWWRRR
jgi:ABC-type uncharacterized transport system involved in gliding motility auxiliary subunit